MQKAQEGNTVKVEYTGRLTNGTEFDSSVGLEPLQFAIGGGDVIPGFDEAVTGMSVGDSKTVTISPEQAYGPRREEFVAVVARKDLPQDVELVAGRQLEVVQEDGSTFLVMVADLTDEKVTLDANHPLAGEELVFEIKLLEIA